MISATSELARLGRAIGLLDDEDGVRSARVQHRRRSFIHLQALGLVVLGAAATCLAPAPLSAQTSAALGGEAQSAARAYPTLQAFADRIVTEGKVQGVVIAIGKGDQPTRFIAAGRLSVEASSPPTTPDTLWRLFSMTKPTTGIAAMILISDGKLKLDQPISDFFPAYKTMGVYVDPEKGGATIPARDLTVRHLLTHTGGLGYAVFAPKAVADQLLAAGLMANSLGRDADAAAVPKRPATLQEFAERRATIPLSWQPGSKFAYSMGLDILAAVVEKASGMPYETFLQKRLLTPLDMRSTFWQVPTSEAYRFASAVNLEKDGRLTVADPGATSYYLKPPSFPFGGAGLVSTARDYDRFLHMLQNGGSLDGKRVLSREAAALAMSNLLPQGVIYSDFGPIPSKEATGFGAGGFVTIVETDGFGRKRGTYGWDGALGTRAWVNPIEKVRVNMMINGGAGLGLKDDFEAALAVDLNHKPASAAVNK
jgi:CubicO group peptidase (beta-lactamase class C family)